MEVTETLARITALRYAALSLKDHHRAVWHMSRETFLALAEEVSVSVDIEVIKRLSMTSVRIFGMPVVEDTEVDGVELVVTPAPAPVSPVKWFWP